MTVVTECRGDSQCPAVEHIEGCFALAHTDTAPSEAQVETVARELANHQGLRGPMDESRPDVWQNRCDCGWDDGDEQPGWRDRYRLHVAAAAIAALPPSPGEEAVEPGLNAESNGRRLAWFTDDELSLELTRRAALASPAPAPCWCMACEHLHVRARTEAGDPLAMFARRFIVCPDCGNKRCPRATHHEHACTGSNEPGQPGSAYAQIVAPPASAEELRARILDQPAADQQGTWRHLRWHEPHPAVPVPGTEYDDPSGKRGARCATCGNGEAVVLDPAPAPQDRYWLCGDDCTTDCGACKGAGRPAPAPQGESVCIHGHAEDDAHVCGEPR